jgi:hypothetical protein
MPMRCQRPGSASRRARHSRSAALLLVAIGALGCKTSLTSGGGAGGQGGGSKGVTGSGGTADDGGPLIGGSGSGGTGAACQPGPTCAMGTCGAGGNCVCGLPLICFGADPTVYEQYLTPRDGGPGIGQCPTPADFRHSCSEGSVCFHACGPLSPAEIGAAHDAGVRASTDGGSDSCCFWVFGIAGV